MACCTRRSFSGSRLQNDGLPCAMETLRHEDELRDQELQQQSRRRDVDYRQREVHDEAQVHGRGAASHRRYLASSRRIRISRSARDAAAAPTLCGTDFGVRTVPSSYP
jgi:hypothetical protein